MKTLVFILVLLNVSFVQAQDILSNYKSKKAAVKDTIRIDTVSIHPSFFKLLNAKNRELDTTHYNIDFQKARLILNASDSIYGDSVTIKYLRFPDFIIRKYSVLNRGIIVDNTAITNELYVIKTPKKDVVPQLLEGLNTRGSISRGVTIGNNQNAVLNSQLDLQISGKIASDVVLSASIQDANIPLQEGGYSQRLDEFDQVFVALEGKDWKVRAGDINLVNDDTYFMRFTKKIQGVLATATFEGVHAKTQVFGAGALVRGNFVQNRFQGQEGNQGPYKLRGPNEELFILIVSGSERVYVNGVQLQRGENNDYVMDYNAGELLFTSRYPITSDMRITVEYQYTNNNYTRFITYGGAAHETETLTIGSYFYSESDARNQPLLQNLSPEQAGILADAGDDMQLMTAPSEVSDTYSENKILYRKTIINGVEAFEYSNDPEAALFNVRFTMVGANNGDYRVASTDAIGKIYEYVAPVGGIPQGNYAPVIQLNAPEKLQMVVLRGAYNPSEKTSLSFETSLSNNDRNLFSGIDDKDNRGFASRIMFKQQLFDKAWSGHFFAHHDYIATEYRNLEGLYQVEFNRDWSLSGTTGNQLKDISGVFGDQSLLHTGIALLHPEKGQLNYRFEQLDFKDYSSGNRHILNADLKMEKLRFQASGSMLNNRSAVSKSAFTRLNARSTYAFKKAWTGVGFQLEDNRQRIVSTDSLTPLSQRFNSYHVFMGLGDSTKVFAQAGYKFRVNDSVNTNRLQRFNTSKTYYVNSQLLANENTRLSAFVSFRDFTYENEDNADEKTLNSRILYYQKFFANLIQWNSVYETLSGTLPQQEFTYLEVDPGQGAYTWIDYNTNGVQELNEFELAQFQDEATYLRVLLPNQVFVKTHQNKFSQTLTFNFGQWSQATGLKKVLSHFYNQTSYLIDRKVRRNGNNFNLNPFSTAEGAAVLGLQQNLRNVLFFNRGKQNYTVSYTYLLGKTRSLLSIGSQENNIISHQIQFAHKLNAFWLANVTGATGQTESFSENFTNRNYDIEEYAIRPKLSYLVNQNSQFSAFYEYETKANRTGTETLQQQRMGVSFGYANAQKVSLNGEFNFFKNDFDGNAFSPVGYQLLEGLQPGNNFTWNVLAQKRITQFLDLNLSYFGRKAQGSRTVHTGSIQLKAYF